MLNMSSTYDAIMYNAQVKRYPDGSAQLLCANRTIFRASGWEARDCADRSELAASDEPAQHDAQRERDNVERSKRRARSAVFDIARSSDFSYFVTLTVSAEKADRYNAEEVFMHLHNWLDNNVRRRGLAYILVPEYHKDGAIHFHALFNDVFPVVDSGTISMPGHKKPRRPRSAAQRAAWLADGGHIVYNLPSWPWGFTTALRLYGDPNSAVGYVVKYISKSKKKIGGRWYYSGGKLSRPDKWCLNISYEQLAQEHAAFRIEELGCDCVKVQLPEGWESYVQSMER